MRHDLTYFHEMLIQLFPMLIQLIGLTSILLPSFIKIRLIDINRKTGQIDRQKKIKVCRPSTLDGALDGY